LAHFAKPVWADINETNGLISVEDVKKKITKKTKAIIAVDWSGKYCDYKTLKSFGLPVIQDAAHCLFVDTQNCGDYICWSTQAIKFLTTADGGFLSVPKEKYEEARLRRWFSLDREASADFRCAQNAKYVGFKYQATDIDAAIGISNLKLAIKNQKKQMKNAEYFNKHIDSKKIFKPRFDKNSQWWLYTILIPDKRDEFTKYLVDNNIASSQVHSRNDKHEVFKDFELDLPGTDYFSENQLSIPVGWWLTEDERKHIVKVINNWNG
jgi:dTDP-4-amino-4,6-dideoxygalactose transaminase